MGSPEEALSAFTRGFDALRRQPAAAYPLCRRCLRFDLPGPRLRLSWAGSPVYAEVDVWASPLPIALFAQWGEG